MKQGRLPVRTMIFCLILPLEPVRFGPQAYLARWRFDHWLASARLSFKSTRAVAAISAESKPLPLSYIVASRVRIWVIDLILP